MISFKTSRSGAVKYTDYAIGKLIEKPKKKAWFDNTILFLLLIIALALLEIVMCRFGVIKFPAIFYAIQKIIKPQIFDVNISQIDIAPTLFGILNLNYKSKFLE